MKAGASKDVVLGDRYGKNNCWQTGFVQNKVEKWL